MRWCNTSKVGNSREGRFIAVRREDTVRLATDRLIQERIGAVPVLDPDGRPVGILTRLDLLRAARTAHCGAG